MKETSLAKLRKTIARKDLSPKHLKFIQTYIESGGNQTIAGKAIGVGTSRASMLMRDDGFQKRIRHALRKVGLHPRTVFKPLYSILKRKGDYHYDFNKLRAIDIYCKLFGLYAPKKIKHSGHVKHTKEEKIDATFRLLKLLKVEGYENIKEGPRQIAEETDAGSVSSSG